MDKEQAAAPVPAHHGGRGRRWRRFANGFLLVVLGGVLTSVFQVEYGLLRRPASGGAVLINDRITVAATNISAGDLAKILADASNGQVIFRPNNPGPITFTTVRMPLRDLPRALANIGTVRLVAPSG